MQVCLVVEQEGGFHGTFVHHQIARAEYQEMTVQSVKLSQTNRFDTMAPLQEPFDAFLRMARRSQ